MKQIKVGVGFGLFQLGMPTAQAIAQVAERAEEWGLDSFWLSDHLLAPSPELDVVATLSLIASRTSRIMRPVGFRPKGAAGGSTKASWCCARSGPSPMRAFTANSSILITSRS